MFMSPIKGNIRITQKFGENPQIYSQFGLKAHPGIDCTSEVKGALVPIYSPYDALVFKVGDQGSGGYGKYVRLLTDKDGNGYRREIILSHLSSISVKQGDRVYLGDKVGIMGNTGFSSGPHLHIGLRRRNEDMTIRSYDNGYFGYIDFEPYILTWGNSNIFYPYHNA